MNLKKALRLERSARVAVVGAGGKTSVIFRLAHELPPPVIVTTTTHLGLWQVHAGDRWIQGVDALADGRVKDGITVITGSEIRNDRVNGPTDAELDRLRTLADENGWSLLIEGDGSKGLPLKAPGKNEPVIPSWVETVIVVAGLTGLGKPCDNAHIHRAEIFCELSGLSLNEPVGEEALVQVLSHAQGGLKGIPENARKVVLLNQAEDPGLLNAASRMAQPLLRSYDAVLIGSLLSEPEDEIYTAAEPIAAILLPTDDLMAHFDLNADRISNKANINNAYSQNITDIPSLKIYSLNNQTQSIDSITSIRLSVQSLPPNIGGVVLLSNAGLEDPAQLVRELIDRHTKTLASIIAHRDEAQRVDAALIDRDLFPDLMALQGDRDVREIFSRYLVESMPWDNDSQTRKSE